MKSDWYVPEMHVRYERYMRSDRYMISRVFQKVDFSLKCKCKQMGAVYGPYEVNKKRIGSVSADQFLTSRRFHRHPYQYDLCPSSIYSQMTRKSDTLKIMTMGRGYFYHILKVVSVKTKVVIRN